MRHTLHTLALSGLLCMGLTSAATIALAQDAPSDTQQQEGHRGHGPMSPEQQLEHMSKALNLSSDQQTQIKPILEARRQQMMQMHEDKSLTRDDRMTKMKSLDDDSHAKIAAVLNDTQKAKFEKMQERREEHMDHMQHGGGDAAGQPAPQQ